MDLQVHVRPDGALRFITSDKTTIVALTRVQLLMLYRLAGNSGARDAQSFARDTLRHVVKRDSSAIFPKGVVQLDPPLQPTHVRPLKDELQQLQQLELVKLPPVLQPQITRRGRQLMEWLMRDWNGWNDYTRQFPF